MLACQRHSRTLNYYAAPGNSDAINAFPRPGNPALVLGAHPPQPAPPHELGTHAWRRAAMASAGPRGASQPSRAIRAKTQGRSQCGSPALGSVRGRVEPNSEDPSLARLRPGRRCHPVSACAIRVRLAASFVLSVSSVRAKQGPTDELTSAQSRRPRSPSFPVEMRARLAIISYTCARSLGAGSEGRSLKRSATSRRTQFR